MIEINHTIF